MLATLFWLSAPQQAFGEGVLRLASDDWCPYVCTKDGKIVNGYLVEVTAKSMAAMGYRVEPVLLPLNRAMSMSASGDVEGVYAPPADARLRPSTVIAYSRACFYTRADSTWMYRGPASIEILRLGVIDDYGYDDGPMDAYIARHHKPGSMLDFSFGATAGTTNVQKLLSGRFPVMLEHESVMRLLSKDLAATRHVRQAGCLEQPLPLRIGFALQDMRKTAWIRALADGMKVLQASGELAAIRERYHIGQ
ncbi:MAG: transporter substrate-binding domain-containing protein [Pseudomonadota bacterium]